MDERIERVTADDGCALWTVRSGDDSIDPGHGFVLCHGGPGFWDTLGPIERCRVLEVPTLIVDGARDSRPRWSVDSLAEALPHCTRVELADSGHFLWLNEPAIFTERVRSFIAE